MLRNQHRVNENGEIEEYVPNQKTGKTSEKDLNKMEISDLHDKEFTIIIKTIHEQSEERTKQITDSNTTTELVNTIKRFNSRLNEQKGSMNLNTGPWNSSAQQKDKSMKKSDYRLKDLWDNINQYSQHEGPKREEKV